MKKLLLGLACFALIFSISSFGLAKKITVACDTNFPPFEFKDPQTGEQTGFDVELWAAIAKKIDLEYELQPMDFNDIIPGLESGQLDVGIAGMTIKPERAKVIDFSDGYYKAGLLLLVRIDNTNIRSIEDLKGKTVATKLGTSSVDYLKTNASGADVKLFPNNDAMFLELMSDGVSAVFFDSPVVSDYLLKAGKGKAKIVGPLYQGEDYGIGFPKGSDLVKKVNDALKTLRADGTYNALYMKWFGPEPQYEYLNLM